MLALSMNVCHAFRVNVTLNLGRMVLFDSVTKLILFTQMMPEFYLN